MHLNTILLLKYRFETSPSYRDYLMEGSENEQFGWFQTFSLHAGHTLGISGSSLNM